MNRRKPLTKGKGATKRPYRSDLRRKQAAGTREQILDALGRTLGRPDARDFTMAEVAREAAVAPATLFRHFANRQALFDEYVARGTRSFGLEKGVSATMDELPEQLRQLYAFYSENIDVMRAMVRDPKLYALNDPARRSRTRRLIEVLREHFPQLSLAERKTTAAVLQLFFTARTWLWFVDEHELDSVAAAEAAATAMQAILDRIEPSPHPAVNDRKTQETSS